MKSDALNFDNLVAAIAHAHVALAEQAAKAVNISLTLRNWLIGYHIREYEQSGEDRGAYGERLLEVLAQRLHKAGFQRVEARELRRFRQFYVAYPQIRETLSTKLPSIQIRETSSPESQEAPTMRAQMMLERLSFSHFAELLQFDDPLQRSFYETEAVRGNWSVRELKRQVSTQYYQRSGLSTDKKTLSTRAIELKNDAFRHEHLGQLNAYVSYYKQHQMSDGDQPPIGILMCTRKNTELVQYALADMSNQLFVSRYQVQLPATEEMAAFLHKAVAELAGGEA